MTNFLLLTIFSSTYGSGNYNASNYNGVDGTTTTTGGGAAGGTAGASGGTLTNTGVMIGLIVGLSALILLTAMIVRIWKRSNSKQIPVQSEEANQ
jgi:hypothetical protein